MNKWPEDQIENGNVKDWPERSKEWLDGLLSQSCKTLAEKCRENERLRTALKRIRTDVHNPVIEDWIDQALNEQNARGEGK